MGASNAKLWRVRFWYETDAGQQVGSDWFAGPFLNQRVSVREGRKEARRYRASTVPASYFRWQVQWSEPKWHDAEGDTVSG